MDHVDPGMSISEFVRRTGLPRKRVERAIEMGQIATAELGGVRRIKPGEVDRVRRLYADEAEEAAS